MATADGGQPWVCTVFFVADESYRLYWLSTPERRHSQNIGKNQHVAVTVPVKIDQPVIGIQAEGMAEVVKDADTVMKVMNGYVKKYGSGENFYDNFVKGTNQHQLYRFIPKEYVIFDELHFPNDPQKHWTPTPAQSPVN